MAQSQFNRGIALIELLMAIAISSIIVGLALQVMVLVRSSFVFANIRFSSKDLLDSTVDIVRSIKESDWNAMSLEGVYHPELSGNQWTLSPGEEEVAGTRFTRSIQIVNVCRDGSLLIVDCPSGTLDPDTKQVLIDVYWTEPISGNISTTQLITRYAGNGFWNQTSQTDFQVGEGFNVNVTSVDDGELALRSNTGPGWADSGRIANLNITNSQTVNSFAIYDDRIFIVKDNDPGGQEFLIYDISTPSSPSLISATELGNNGKKILIYNGYAYVATSDDSQELRVFNISDPTAPLPQGNLDLPGSSDAINLGISESRLYVVRALDGTQDEFYTVNISNPSLPAVVSSQNFSDGINDIFISGRYAYLSTSIDNQEVVVLDLTLSPPDNLAGSFNISGNENAIAISYDYPNIFVSSAQNKVFIFSASSPDSITQIGEVSLNNIGDIYLADNKAFFTDRSSAQGMYIYDVTSPASPSFIGNHSIGANAFEVTVIGGNAFVATSSNVREIIVVNGGGSDYVSKGEFFSSLFDTQNGLTSIQSVSWDADIPEGTTVGFQIATNALGYGFEYLGPDGTPATYYTSTGTYPLGSAAGQYIKVKAILLGNSSETPIINDFRITYIQ